MAEKVRFELTERQAAQLISSQPPSTTRPLLRTDSNFFIITVFRNQCQENYPRPKPQEGIRKGKQEYPQGSFSKNWPCWSFSVIKDGSSSPPLAEAGASPDCAPTKPEPPHSTRTRSSPLLAPRASDSRSPVGGDLPARPPEPSLVKLPCLG